MHPMLSKCYSISTGTEVENKCLQTKMTRLQVLAYSQCMADLYESKGNFLSSNNLSGILDRFKGRQYL